MTHVLVHIPQLLIPILISLKCTYSSDVAFFLVVLVVVVVVFCCFIL